MKLARAIHLDESDRYVFDCPAQTGEWCISGGFEFSNWTEANLTGKARQAFANGWFGLETGGRATFVAVTKMEESELEAMTNTLAEHFVEHYGAPSADAARPVAVEELSQMVALCETHDANTLLTVSRELTEAGVREVYRVIKPQDADLGQIAIHGSLDDL